MRPIAFATALLMVMLPGPGLSRPSEASFTQRLHRYAVQLGIPGFSAAVVQNGKIVYRHFEGVADRKTGAPIEANSLFGIASVTKSMTGIILAQLEAEGRMRFDDPLLAYPLNVGWHPPESIGNPNITIGDVLSMSGGGQPGETYVYNGARFNLLSGLFDKISGIESPQSYVVQNRRRILDPLGMRDTIAGFPPKPTVQSLRAVKRYEAQPSSGGWSYVERPYDWDAAYPASGLISTIDDMAKYARALDRNELVSRAQYDRLTSPRNGHPYGFGWFTQKSYGLLLHWVFGYGQAESALFLRVPDKKLTFIFFANADTPSALAQLDYADVLRQPFGLAFIESWVEGNKSVDFDRPAAEIARQIGTKPSPMVVEALLDEALLQSFRARMTGSSIDRATALTELLLDIAPERFAQPDVYMLRLLSDVRSPRLEAPARRLIAAFNLDTDYRPVTAFWSGNVLERLGEREAAMRNYRLLCDRPGFDDETMKAQACERLGSWEVSRGERSAGNTHLGHSALISRNARDGAEFDRKVKLIGTPEAPVQPPSGISTGPIASR